MSRVGPTATTPPSTLQKQLAKYIADIKPMDQKFALWVCALSAQILRLHVHTQTPLHHLPLRCTPPPRQVLPRVCSTCPELLSISFGDLTKKMEAELPSTHELNTYRKGFGIPSPLKQPY